MLREMAFPNRAIEWLAPGVLWLWLFYQLHDEWTLNPQYNYGWIGSISRWPDLLPSLAETAQPRLSTSRKASTGWLMADFGGAASATRYRRG